MNQEIKSKIITWGKLIWKHPLIVVASNILLVMLLYSLTRIFTYFAVRSMFPNVTFAHFMEMMVGGMRFDLTAVLYLSSLYIIASLFPVPAHWRENLIFQRVLKWCFWIPNAIGLSANIIDISYIPFTDRRTTCTFFSEFSEGVNFSHIIGQSLVDYWHLLLAILVVLTVLFVCSRRRFDIVHARRWVYYAREISIFILAIYFSVIGIRGGFGRYTRPLNISNAMQYAHTPRECALILNTPFTLMQSLGVPHFKEAHYFPQDELPRHMTPIHPADTTQMRTDNVVVLILESFSMEYIGFYNEGKGYTPFLDSLLQKSVTFDYSYASGRKSIDAMPSVLSSIPMLIESYVVTPYATNAISSIADCLRRKGYYTAFFHGAPNGSMGFQAYARGAGFEAYYGKDEYKGPEAFDGTWAIWDEEFLQYYAKTMTTFREPFMTSVFTASSHHPFKVPERYKGRFPKGPEKICEPIGYSDNALRRFFETASKQPWFDHTLFVITADHTNLLHCDEYNNDQGWYEVPIAFYHPQMTAERRADVVSQTDIMPSVLGFLGYNQPYFAFGEDALSRPKDHHYAICYNATVFQIFSDSLLVQFDGEKVTGVYDFHTDRCLRNNIAGSVDSKRIAPMLDYLKAYIQQYTHRMIHNELTVKE